MKFKMDSTQLRKGSARTHAEAVHAVILLSLLLESGPRAEACPPSL